MKHLDANGSTGRVSSHRRRVIEVMDWDGRYKDVNSHNRPGCGVRGELSPTHHGSPLHSRNSASSVSPAAGDDRLRASAPRGMRAHEGGPGPARMKKRLLTGLLAAGVLVSAAFTAWTIPAAAQQVHVQLPTGEVVPVDVPPGTEPQRHPAAGPDRPADHAGAGADHPGDHPQAEARDDSRARDDARTEAKGARHRPDRRRRLAAGALELGRARAARGRRRRAPAQRRRQDSNPRMSLRRTGTVVAVAPRSATTTARRRAATPVSSMRCRVRR